MNRIQELKGQGFTTEEAVDIQRAELKDIEANEALDNYEMMEEMRDQEE